MCIRDRGIDYSGRDKFYKEVKQASKSAQMSVQNLRNKIMGTDKVAKVPSLIKKSKGAPSKTNKGILLKKGSKIDYSGAKAFKDALKKKRRK